MKSPLADAFQYYLDHQDEILAEHDGEVVVIKDAQILQAYPDEFTAIAETEKTHALGTFLVQRVSPGSDDYTQTFHSEGVVFS